MMTPQRGHVKDIIEEYNLRFQSWGNSDTWGLTEFKVLEDMIYESSKMRINANTLKRFFQQRTSNPQLATNNALCVFLGYANYSEFVMKKTGKKEVPIIVEEEMMEPVAEEPVNPVREPEEKEQPVVVVPPVTPPAFSDPKKSFIKRKRNLFHLRIRKSIVYLLIIIGIIALVIANWGTLVEKYENHAVSTIVFESVNTKGASPYTAKIEYNIPYHLIEDISVDCVEANGDVTTRKLTQGQHEFYATFIYPGTSYCYLKYKNKIVRTLAVESRMRGWSTYLTEDRTKLYLSLPFSKAETKNGYLTLPIVQIPQKAITDKLFVSYTYYTDSIIDGDNFIAEARVRNSATEDHGIPCYDIMMYVFSNTGLHGFSLNENCYSYLKFISGENKIPGDQYDLSRFNFNPAQWHVMRIEVINKKTTFYLDGEEVLKMDYQESLGAVNELTLRFKGCGAVDYVKVMNLKQEVVYQEDF